MNAQTLRDLLAPPEAGPQPGSGAGVDNLAQTLLARFVREAQSEAPLPSDESLSMQAEQALYAWGVICYEQGRHREAAALFHALTRRCAASPRLFAALGAAHLAGQEPARAAAAFGRAHALDPTDAELVFHWAQAQWCCARADEARRLLHTARELLATAPGKWPHLTDWCNALHDRMASASSHPSRPPL